MLAINPLGGVLLRSIGMFLQTGRRGSAPQVHALMQREGSRQTVNAPPPRQEEVIQRLSSKRGLVPPQQQKQQQPQLQLGQQTIESKPKTKSKQKKNKKATKKMEEPKKKPNAAVSNKSATKMIENLKKRTHFTRQEIESLCKVYNKLVASAANNLTKAVGSATVPTPGLPPMANRIEGLDRVVFRELIHNTFDLVTEEVLIDRIFCAFDRNNDGVVKLDNWVCGLSTFLRGTPEQRTAFCFLVYDLNGDGFITREEMIHLLRNCLMKAPQDEDPEEGVRDLVELALRKLDIDKDGKVSYQDFLQAVHEEPLLLEAFGQCLPAESACQTFLSTLHA